MMFLGVDGGGTKTAFCLIDSTGTVRARALGDGAYYFADQAAGGVDHVVRVLERGIGAVTGAAGLTPADIDHAFLGLPGYGEVPGDLAALDAAPGLVLGHRRYTCDNDMICGWAGSLGAVDGINVISGTGSMAYGERRGRGVRTGGWSELFSDEGSAYWIAARALNLFSRMSDGRLPEGPLADLLRRHLALTADLEVIDIVLNRWQGHRSEIAALTPVVVEAAGAGDGAAAALLTEAGGELALLVDSARRRLGFSRDETTPVSYSGGVFRSALVRDAFTAALGNGAAAYELRHPLFEPVVGAALYAAKLAGTPLGTEALAALRAASDPTTAEVGHDDA
ncbi:N-acetylglucosamine kinase [Streptomyces kronopolitis]|uniref:N-acetylglucosamine kinase n=1 Tax=Streptomyces kronopolitis TaxID=1612435 RepID=A0ABQ2K4E2_9ACTN|nr:MULTISPECIES: BadF/BadG/BcrA/BcrD ATPase family protein [Streptomyces]GGN64085.1 N-acetylglucosamine kinase [Streptomyces kronopolitis]GLW17183.1 N-acetylglucosamine kinase [Streptomyces sp. NBRC 13847]